MNIRTAILKAADSIEQNPHLFSFKSLAIPNKDCGTPGCAIGWIAYHSGLEFDAVQVYDGNGYILGRSMSEGSKIYKWLGIRADCCFGALSMAS